MTSTDSILQLISEIHIPRFFYYRRLPANRRGYSSRNKRLLKEKYDKISHGASGRKFIYQESGWRMAFTFYPTDRVVDEKYAMKNKMIKKR